ncbi:MAG: phosphoenolpyruvate synthase [archaeon]
MLVADKYVKWFKDLGIKDVPTVGGKNASLGEMYRNLTKKGVKVPNGFAITAGGYQYLLKEAGIKNRIKEILTGLDVSDIKDLMARGQKVRDLIKSVDLPKKLEEEIITNYRFMSKMYKVKEVDVAVRSSATAEDLPNASFAGQQETFLNIRGEEELLMACRKCFASLFTNRAIAYRQEKGFDHFSVYLSIAVQKMARSDLASSGVMFSIDTESGFKNAVFITGSYGLGENVVQGAVNPDEFYVFKPTLNKGRRPILSKRLGEKKIKMIYTKDPKKPVRNVEVPLAEREKFCITDDEILELATYAVKIEDHYSKEAGYFKPMDIEWAKDGQTGELFIVQARPETVHSQLDSMVLKKYILKGKGKILSTGRAVGEMIGVGKARVLTGVKDIEKFQPGEILVTEMTDPDWVPIMKIASAIVTNKGGRTCHAAIVSRELGIPCIVGTLDATKKVKTGQDVTVSCAEGEEGRVYEGKLKFDIDIKKLTQMEWPRTKIMLNLGTPSSAFEKSFLPNDGVGLAREEFIINEHIKIHPLALLDYATLKDKKVKAQIDKLTKGYNNKGDFFVDKLAEGVGLIAAAFYPNDVIVRLSDFKSNEYFNLIGGYLYEPKEENPMIGWRGASRYYSKAYERAFVLECKALVKVRNVMGLNNVKVMVPFCRTLDEGRKVLDIMAKNGMKRGENGLEVYVMCEIPSNIILADQFADLFDGFSIGSNDLTQLTLGLDRDSALVASVYDERNEAVLRLVESVIKTAKKKKRKVGICGQAPSDFPDFAEFIVKCGIDSVSLNPDTVVKTAMYLAQVEKKLGIKRRKLKK